jgi:glutamate-1-semialdehyde 2,1-aminomutase
MNNTWKIKKSLKLQAKAAQIIPGMTQLLSKRPDLYSRGVWPTYFSQAKGSLVTDLDGNQYVDCSIGGVGATVLGYADKDVNRAVISAIRAGSASTLNPPEEVYLAEKLIDLHPWAHMVRFARSGGEAMAMAVRIARVATRKDVVVFCGYHGWMDWYLAANLGKSGALDDQWIPGLPPNGVPKGLAGTAIPFRFNNVKSFTDAIRKAGKNLAAIVMEPIRNFYPTAEFMNAIHETAAQEKVPLIMDEISAGFRICTGGAHLKLGWNPDMAVFSKALGNGFPISAVIGKRAVMSAAQEAFITSTNWTERVGPTAALAMIHKFEQMHVANHLVQISDRVWSGWEELGRKHRITIEIGGFKPMIHFSFAQDSSVNRAFFTQEMLKRGFLASTGFYSMYAHSSLQINRYLAAADDVFGELRRLTDKNEVMKHLKGLPATAGFGRIN